MLTRGLEYLDEFFPIVKLLVGIRMLELFWQLLFRYIMCNTMNEKELTLANAATHFHNNVLWEVIGLHYISTSACFC